MSDIEIARNAKLKNILEITKDLGIDEENVEPYGKYKAKLDYKKINTNQDNFFVKYKQNYLDYLYTL